MTLSTKIHYYRIDTTTPQGQEEYKALINRIKADCPEARGRKMHAIGIRTEQDRDRDNTTETIEIETDHLFENQWNSTEKRVFDWWENVVYIDGKRFTRIRCGHWLEITGEMADARRLTRKCGYCGKQYGPYHTERKGVFCPDCLDSPYLKETELHLLRLLPLTGCQVREKLSDAECYELLPKYVARQTTGNDSRAKAAKEKEIMDVGKKYTKAIVTATAERDGMAWLHTRGFSLDNVIYYNHTEQFGFGWRNGVSASVESKLLDVLSEFSFPYTIKTEDGRKLSG